MWKKRFCLIGFLFMFGSSGIHAQPLDLMLPTANDALLRGDGAAFYMYTNRYFEGRNGQPWQAGTYGFVRNPRRTSAGLIYTRRHEGVDIQPLRRDVNGEPLDVVRAIDTGRVVYVNDRARRSSFGIYVVVEHYWGGSPFYSLYAHMSEAYVETGAYVAQGDRLGRIGYTGVGLDRERAHLHFEIGILVNRYFQQWYDRYYAHSRNKHGLYNGMNLRGLNVATLYTALQEQPDLTIQAFIAQQTPYYRIIVPREASLDLLTRYPWLAPEADHALSTAWEVAFTRSGVPIDVAPVQRPPDELPLVSMSPPDLGPCDLLTSDILAGPSGRCHLGEDGTRYLDLLTLTGPPAAPPELATPGQTNTQSRVAW